MFRNVSILILILICLATLGRLCCYDTKDTYLNAYALSHGVSSLEHVNGNSDWDSTIWRPTVPYSNQQFYQRFFKICVTLYEIRPICFHLELYNIS